MNPKKSLEIRLSNMRDPRYPRCEYCGEDLPPKYDKDGIRIRKSGGFWTHHMQNCEKRFKYFKKKEKRELEAEEGFKKREHEGKISRLRNVGFTTEQSETLLDMFGEKQ